MALSDVVYCGSPIKDYLHNEQSMEASTMRLQVTSEPLTLLRIPGVGVVVVALIRVNFSATQKDGHSKEAKFVWSESNDVI